MWTPFGFEAAIGSINVGIYVANYVAYQLNV